MEIFDFDALKLSLFVIKIRYKSIDPSCFASFLSQKIVFEVRFLQIIETYCFFPLICYLKPNYLGFNLRSSEFTLLIFVKKVLILIDLLHLKALLLYFLQNSLSKDFGSSICFISFYSTFFYFYKDLNQPRLQVLFTSFDWFCLV